MNINNTAAIGNFYTTSADLSRYTKDCLLQGSNWTIGIITETSRLITSAALKPISSLSQAAKEVAASAANAYGYFTGSLPQDLDHLKDLDIKTVERLLDQSSSTEIWDHFLKGQARLFFYNHDLNWLSKKSWWQSARNVLEIGSGNGCYLSLIQKHFPEKKVEGVDYDSKYVNQASKEYPHIAFCQGNAEEKLPKAEGSFDVVFLRYTLSWLKNPVRALELAHRYVKPGGKILLIDAYDRAGIRTNEIPSLEYSVSELRERGKQNGKANREISMEIFKSLQNNTSPLRSLYTVHSSNLDLKGNRSERGLLFESKVDLKRYLNQNLLWFGIMKKQHGIVVDLPTARRELELYETEGFQTGLGAHYLVLEKK